MCVCVCNWYFTEHSLRPLEGPISELSIGKLWVFIVRIILPHKKWVETIKNVQCYNWWYYKAFKREKIHSTSKIKWKSGKSFKNWNVMFVEESKKLPKMTYLYLPAVTWDPATSWQTTSHTSDAWYVSQGISFEPFDSSQGLSIERS